MSARSEMLEAGDPGYPVWHFDGRTARKRFPALIPDRDGFRLIDGDDTTGPFVWADLVAQDKTGGEQRYGLRGEPGWRIGLAEPIPTPIAARLPRPERYGRLIDRFGLVRASIAFLAVASLVLLAGWKAPGIIAPYVPQSWERQLGEAMVGNFGGRFCNGPGGQEALDALTRQLNPNGVPLDVRVANIPMVNAVALPGGKIVIFRELLREANSPDEVAGVLGHEIGHVQNRDVMQALLRQAGLSILLGGLGGDAGAYIDALLSATYSREAEARADRASIAAMTAANISPADTAGFFKRLGKLETEMGAAAGALVYISSHPLSSSREKLFAASVEKGRRYRPSLTRDQWDALVDICRSDADVRTDKMPFGR